MRPERRTSDPDEQKVLERPAARRRDPANVHIRGEFLDARIGLLDIRAQLIVRRELRIAQPVVTDHPVFVRVGDPAGFEIAHRGERFLDLRLHLFEEAIGKAHPADIERKPEIVVVQVILLKSLPKRVRSHGGRIMDGRPLCRPEF